MSEADPTLPIRIGISKKLAETLLAEINALPENLDREFIMFSSIAAATASLLSANVQDAHHRLQLIESIYTSTVIGLIQDADAWRRLNMEHTNH
jgi:hypothetical protein